MDSKGAASHDPLLESACLHRKTPAWKYSDNEWLLLPRINIVNYDIIPYGYCLQLWISLIIMSHMITVFLFIRRLDRTVLNLIIKSQTLANRIPRFLSNILWLHLGVSVSSCWAVDCTPEVGSRIIEKVDRVTPVILFMAIIVWKQYWSNSSADSYFLSVLTAS